MADRRRTGDEAPTLVASDAAATSEMTVDVGVLVTCTSETEPEQVREFAARAAADAVDELGSATDVTWRFYLEEAARLPRSGRRRPSEFLDRATQEMVEGPYDIVVVLTDAPLVSSREQFVPGLASPLARVAVLSTRNLGRAPRGEPPRALDDAAVRWNGATLLRHLLGHVLGARHRDADGASRRRSSSCPTGGRYRP